MLGGWGRKGFWLIGFPVFLIVMLGTPIFWGNVIVFSIIASIWYYTIGHACSYPILGVVAIIVGGTAFSVWSRASR